MPRKEKNRYKRKQKAKSAWFLFKQIVWVASQLLRIVR